jgi:hypothetical protein
MIVICMHKHTNAPVTPEISFINNPTQTVSKISLRVHSHQMVRQTFGSYYILFKMLETKITIPESLPTRVMM